MNIFTDFHHAGLLQSLILLFERRLKGAVYRPIGMNWYHKGYWNVYPHIDTARQYLEIGNTPKDNTPPLNVVKTQNNDVYKCQDIDSGETNKGITFEGFMALPIDFIIASIPQHLYPFKRLKSIHPNNPKLIYQIGNEWNIPTEHLKGIDAILCSAYVDINNFEKIPHVIYHQEFDTEVFSYSPPTQTKKITSLVNCFSTADHFTTDWQLFEKVEKLLPHYEFRALGGSCRDGNAHGNKQVADTIRQSQFIWHTKAGGDGYGHIIHNTYAMGRVPIVKLSQYHGKLAGDLMIDGVNCIDIDNMSAIQVAQAISAIDDRKLEIMSKNAYDTFCNVVNFPIEVEKINAILRKLL